MRKIGFLLGVGVFCFKNTQAQIKDTLTVSEVSYYGVQFFDTPISSNTIQSDSLKTNQSISNVLQNNTPIFIKEYGNGMLATPSSRGLGSSHTQVIWNGIPLNSSTNGGFDFNLLESGLIDVLKYVPGGNTSYFGESSMGGTVILENKPISEKGFSARLNTSYGSFNTLGLVGKIGYASAKFAIDYRAVYKKSDNDYSYTFNREEYKVKNSDLENKAHQIQLFYDVNSIHKLRFSYLNTTYNRGLIESKGGNSKQFQTDKNQIASLNYTYNYSNILVILNQSFEDTSLEYYTDRGASVFSISKTKSLSTNASLKYILTPSFKLYSNLNYQLDKAKSRNINKQFNKQFTGSLGIQYMLDNWWVTADSRIGNHSDFNLPVSYTFGLGVVPKNSKIWFSLKKNYRLPTFNDLYWQPGGNPDLKSEDGLMYDLNYVYELKKNDSKFRFNTSVYMSKFKNWIQWVPNVSYWSPVNFKKVNGLGAEITLNYERKVGNLKFFTNQIFSYTKSINQNSGKQLIYVPRVKLNSSIRLGFNQCFFMGLNYKYLDRIYATTDHSVSIPKVGLWGVDFSKKITKKMFGFNGDFQFSILNLTNKEYERVLGRPMPKINYNIKLNIKL